MQSGVERHSAKMFSNRLVEIEAAPALIGLPPPQKHFHLHGCSWVGREQRTAGRGAEGWGRHLEAEHSSFGAAAGNIKLLTPETKEGILK